MSNSKVLMLLIYFIFQFVLLFFISYEQILHLSLFNSIVLIIVSSNGLLSNFKAIYLFLLGYAVIILFDIYKFNKVFLILRTDLDIPVDIHHEITVFYIYLALIIFLFSYLVFNRKEKLNFKETELNQYSYYLFLLPCSFAILLNLGHLRSTFGDYNIYILILSFFPKTFLVISFYLFVRSKKIHLLLISLVFFYAYFEISRKVYITLAFILFAIIASKFLITKGRISLKQKSILYALSLFAFFWMNYLRSDFFSEIDYSFKEKMERTYDYMLTFKAIDTYDNTAFILRNYPRKVDYNYGSTYLGIVSQLIPSRFWKNKPGGFGAVFGYIRKSGRSDFTRENWKLYANGFSGSPGYLGEAYANFGKLGIFLLPFFTGIFLAYYDKNFNVVTILQNPNQLPYTALYSSFFLINRGDFVSATFFSVIYFVWLYLMIKILQYTK